jgi:zinc protease
MVYKSLGGWENPNWIPPRDIPDFDEISEPITVSVPINGKVQSDLIIGCHGPSRISGDFLPASIGNNILGQFGMMGRIGTAVREKSGLAYYASTSLNAWLKGGSWEISAGVSPVNLSAAINLIFSELEKFTGEFVSEEELEDAKSSYIGSLPLSVESNNGVASAIIRMERFNLGLNYMREFPIMVERVTKEDILRVAKKYINPKKMITVSAGPEIIIDSIKN